MVEGSVGEQGECFIWWNWTDPTAPHIPELSRGDGEMWLRLFHGGEQVWNHPGKSPEPGMGQRRGKENAEQVWLGWFDCSGFGIQVWALELRSSEGSGLSCGDQEHLECSQAGSIQPSSGFGISHRAGIQAHCWTCSWKGFLEPPQCPLWKCFPSTKPRAAAAAPGLFLTETMNRILLEFTFFFTLQEIFLKVSEVTVSQKSKWAEGSDLPGIVSFSGSVCRIIPGAVPGQPRAPVLDEIPLLPHLLPHLGCKELNDEQLCPGEWQRQTWELWVQPCTDLPVVLRDNLWCPFPFLEQLGAPMMWSLQSVREGTLSSTSWF